MLPFGIDVSRYNYSADGKILLDFDKLKSHPEPIIFIGIRDGISWGYQDPWFNRSWAEAKRVGFMRMAYHVPYFGEDPYLQADNLFKIVTPVDWEHDRIVLDCEVAHTNAPYKITQTTNYLLEICRSRTGRYPIIYSRASWVNEHMRAQDLPKVDWWLAQYNWNRPYPLYTPERTPPPDLPTGVDDWLIHQTGHRCPSIGTTSMHYMDYNRWNGDLANVMLYFGYSDEPQPTPEPSLQERVKKLEHQYDDLEIRVDALERPTV